MRSGLPLVVGVLAVAACSADEIAYVGSPPAEVSTVPAPPAGTTEPPPGVASPGALRGAVTERWGEDDVNRCVPDVPSAVAALRDQGDALGFHLAGFTDDLFYVPGSSKHWQGVQRVPYGDGRTVVVSRGGAPMFAAVRFESRGAEGAAVGANRVALGAPDVADRVVAEMPEPDGFAHAGGMQAIGRYVAVPLENGRDASRVVIADLADAAAPVAVGTLVRDAAEKEAGGAGLAKLADGRYLAVVAHADANELAWYITPSLSDWSATTRLGTMGAGGYVGHEHGSYQTVNLVTQCDGALFLLGLHGTSNLFGEDRLDAWRVVLGGATPTLAWVTERHVRCSENGGERQCNFTAGAGVYVDPGGALIVYATEHRASGPEGTVKMTEFAPLR